MLLIYLVQFYFLMNFGAVMVKDVTFESPSVFDSVRGGAEKDQRLSRTEPRSRNTPKRRVQMGWMERC